jgi:streptogramin lyase
VILVSAPLAGLSPSTTYHFRIAVTTALGTSYGADETFETMSAVPRITSISPMSGSTAGGTAVTVKGANFVAPLTVTIGGAATSVEVLSETEIKAKTAATLAGPYEVVVSNGYGSSTQGPTFTYSPTGASYTSSFGSLGSGSGELKHPEGVALDAKGDVWVVDSGNYRVDEFSSEGQFMRAFGWGVATGEKTLQTCSSGCKTGLPGSGPGQLGVEGAYKQAVGIAVAPESAGGDLWVADPGNARVTEFKPEANEVKYETEIHSNGPVTLVNPQGVAVDASGNVWVADWNGSLDEFSSGGVSLLQVPSSSPDGVAIDPSTGNVWVSEVSVQRVSEFKPSGALVETIGWGVHTGAEEFQTCMASCQNGRPGSGAGQFQSPTGISVGPKGHLWVMENWNARVQEFSASGEYVAQFGSYGSGAGQLYGPWGLAVGSETAYFGDSGNNRVEKWAAWE